MESLISVLTADDNYSLLNRDNIRRDYLKKKKLFLNFFFNFEIFNLNIFKQKMTLIADLFYEIRKTRLDICPKSPFQTTLSALVHRSGQQNVTIFSDHFEGN